MFTNALSYAKKSINICFDLKDKQIETLKHLYDGKDCVSILPTGYGKSVIFQLLPFLFQFKRKTKTPGIVIIVCPLNSLMQDQVMSLSNKGIKACFLSVEGTGGLTYNVEGKPSGDEEGDQLDIYIPHYVSLDDLQHGHFHLIYAHPETLLRNHTISTMLRSKTYRENVCAIVVDEVHMISEWGPDFRTAFKDLSELTCLFPLPTSVHLALTATATRMVVADLTKELCLADPVIVSSNPDRPNIFIEVCRGLPNVNKMDKLDAALEPIARELREKLLSFPVTVVYVNDLASLGYCYQYIEGELQDNAYHPKTEKIPENRIFGQFHKDYTLRMKTHIVDELRKSNPKLRLIFATVALGMGLNSPCISSVIHFRPPTTLEKYFQEIGRAGRNGQPANAIMYYNMSDLASNRKGLSPAMREFCLNSTTCLRKQIVNHFGFDSVLYNGEINMCCSNCRTST